jgi:preprotein translocase subunit SecG
MIGCLAAAAVFAVVGLVAGLMPLHAQGVHCGSAFAASGDLPACDAVRSVARILAVMPLVLAGALLIAALVLETQRNFRRTDTAER